MTTQKTFKQRVRTRMAKTGESYTAARHQLLQKAAEPDMVLEEPVTGPPLAAPAADVLPATGSAPGADPVTSPSNPSDVPPATGLVSDDAMQRGSGRSHAEWFALLDEWGARERSHTGIARWLVEAQGVGGWWAQSIAVAFERARGMRAEHEMKDGYSVSVTRTLRADPVELLAAFTDPERRERWLPGAPMSRRPTRAAHTARFDWDEPASRVVVNVIPKGEGRTTLAVAHERLPDADTAQRLKAAWRGWLDRLKATLDE